MLELGQRNKGYHERLVGGLSMSAVRSVDWISPGLETLGVKG